MTKHERLPYAVATRAACIGLVLNLALAIVKLVAGLVGNSFALLSDAANSLGDVFTSIVVIVALRMAQKPPDKEHPYGHSRLEAIAGSNVAVLIFVSAIWIGWEAISRFWQMHPIPPAWTLWIAGGNFVIKEALYRYKIRVGKQTGSTSIIANAWDHRSDALCSLAVLIGLAVVRVGGQNYIWADELAALIVVLAIMFSALNLLWLSTHELMDAQADDQLVSDIRKSVLQTEGILDAKTLRVRKSGLEYFVDVHIEVEPNQTVKEGHRIGHIAKEKLLRDFPTVRDVLVHLEPFDEKNAPR